jgi:glucose-6-phosphate 1-dehydrogenase
MPALFKAQNGREIHQNTKVVVSGCARAKTHAQKLKAALEACHSKHSHVKRQACERSARKIYGQLNTKRGTN